MSKFKQFLEKNDFSGFQKDFRNYLKDILTKNLFRLNEEMDDVEKKSVMLIQLNAKFCGAYEKDFSYENGIVVVDIPSRDGSLDFSKFLEDSEFVDSYEITALRYDVEDGVFEEEDFDLEEVFDDTGYSFQFVIYLEPSVVDFSNFDEYDYDGSEDPGDYNDLGEQTKYLPEVRRKIRVNARGKKTIKFKCVKGFKWNPNSKTCEKITGDQLTSIRRAVRKALLTKKNEGLTLQKRVILKRRKALKYRKSYGL